MSIPWPTAVIRGRKLTVYSALASKSPVWNHVIGRLLDEFNAVSKKHSLGVKLAASAQAPKEGGGADVAINTALDKISVSFPGADPVAETFDGTRLHGRTLLMSRRGTMLKAFVFLPAKPQINTPSGQRLVGPKVLTLIALHELVHACGLEDGDHAGSGLFQGYPAAEPGDTPIGDKVRVQQTVYHRYMPPYVLDESTVKALQSLWTP